MQLRRARVAALGLIAAQAGCYRYVPSPRESLPPAATVRIDLTAEGTEALVSTLGGQVHAVVGIVQRVATDTVVVELRETMAASRQSYSSSGAVVAIPHRYVERISVRRTSVGRTVAVAAVGAATAVFVYLAARPRGDQGEVPRPNPNPQP